MSKIMIIGDTHFGLSRKGKSKYYLNNQVDFFKKYVIPNQKQVDYIIFLGDVFDNRKTIDFSVLKIVKEEIFNNISKKTFIILGNHDIYYNDSNEINSPELLLSEYKNISVIKNIMKIDNNILLVPWLSNRTMIDYYKTEIKRSINFYVFGHFEIKEFMPNDKDFTFDINDFKNNRLVFSGHIHKSIKKNNIIYTSTPYDLDWSDINDEKGIYILDTCSGEYYKIKNKDRLYKVIYFNELEKININLLEMKIVRVLVDEDINRNELDLIKNKCKYCLDFEIIKNTDRSKNISDLKSMNISKFDDLEKYVINKMIEDIPESKNFMERIFYG